MTRQMTEQEAREKLIELGEQSLRKAIRGISETVYVLEHGKGEHCLERLEKLGHTVTVTEPDCETE